ncbi:MAG TPA: amidohydrolase family protein [Steroidobacteraceae bacterium]|jgi:imidazolonepropionase-like amidohydrolase|nr:amidohydrolase family protein [Steroidobacteraceae bacterium]
MNRSIACAAMAGAALTLSACATHGPQSGLVVANVTVVSPERARPLEHAYVRILDGRIAELSERPLRGAEEIDGSGRYLIPGLIDSHVHLAVAPGFPAPMTAAQAAAHPELVAAALDQDPRSYLLFGFTTVVDLVGSAERTAQWNSRALRPDAYFCSAAVIINGQIRFVLFPYFSYGLSLEQRIPPVLDAARHTPEAIVGRMAADGAICVKTVYEQFMGITPSVDELKSLVTAAHAHDLPVFIHANRKHAQAVAVAAGVDVIAHGMWREAGEAAALDDEAREILAAIVRDHIGYQPTTQVIAGELDMMLPDYLARPELADAYPAGLIALYASEGAAGTPDWSKNAGIEAQSSVRETLGRAAEVTRILADAHAHLLFGSDTPSDFIYSNPPGLNGRREMDNWIAAGVSAEKLFHALTIDNARSLHLQDRIGTVEAGKAANLLLLRADPLRSVAAYDTIETVFLHGRPISRAMLSARAIRSQ